MTDKTMVTVWYWIREWSESWEFPEAHIFADEDEARRTMVAEALEVQKQTGGWVTEVLDGRAITHVLGMGGNLARTVNSLNVQREGGAVDCFRLMSQEVKQ